MKGIYTAPNRDAAQLALNQLEEKRGQKYGYPSKAGEKTGRNSPCFWTSTWRSERSSIPPTSSKT